MSALLLTLGLAVAGELPNCENPRDAANTLLALQQPSDYRPEAAASCLDLPPELEGQGAKVAVQLKQVLDARGHFVRVPDLADSLEVLDEDGQPVDEIVLVDQLPVISLERVGDRWLWSQDSVRAAEPLYRETFKGLGSWVQSRLPAIFSSVQVGGYSPWQAVYFGLLAGLAALLTLLANLILQGRVRGLLKRVGIVFDKAVFARTRGPMRLVVASGVLLWGTPDAQLGVKLSGTLLFTWRLLLSVGVVWMAVRWIELVSGVLRQRAAKTDTRMDDQLVPLLGRLSKVVAVSLGLVFVLQNVGVDVGSIVAGLGIGGIALALGAQQSLSNLFGSLMIFLDRPFHVGDWVIVDGSIEGTVEEVGFRSTRIRSFASSLITVPNSTVATSKIENMGERKLRRMKLTLGLTYDTPTPLVQAFVEGARAIVQAHPDTFKESYEIHFRDFSASSLDVLVYVFLDVPDWHRELKARSEILLQIKDLAGELGVDFAFPTTSVWMEQARERPVPADLPRVVDAYGPDGARARTDFAVTAGWNAGLDTERGDG